jgi:hypothetical protein
VPRLRGTSHDLSLSVGQIKSKAHPSVHSTAEIKSAKSKVQSAKSN